MKVWFILILQALSSFAPPDWAKLREALLAYERANILPVWQAQRARLQTALSGKEAKLLEKLQGDYEKLQAGLEAWQKKPSTPADRDEMLKKLKEIYNALTPIQERHAKLLAAFAQEREPLKEKWRAEMNEIIAQYNAQVNPYLNAFFAKHNFGNYDDEDAFLLLRNVLPTKQEAGAGAGEED